MRLFDTTVVLSLHEIYGCNGIDGFEDLLEEKLGHPFSDATWKATGLTGNGSVLVRVYGRKGIGDEEDA